MEGVESNKIIVGLAQGRIADIQVPAGGHQDEGLVRPEVQRIDTPGFINRAVDETDAVEGVIDQVAVVRGEAHGIGPDDRVGGHSVKCRGHEPVIFSGFGVDIDDGDCVAGLQLVVKQYEAVQGSVRRHGYRRGQTGYPHAVFILGPVGQDEAHIEIRVYKHGQLAVIGHRRPGRKNGVGCQPDARCRVPAFPSSEEVIADLAIIIDEEERFIAFARWNVVGFIRRRGRGAFVDLHGVKGFGGAPGLNRSLAEELFGRCHAGEPAVNEPGVGHQVMGQSPVKNPLRVGDADGPVHAFGQEVKGVGDDGHVHMDPAVIPVLEIVKEGIIRLDVLAHPGGVVAAVVDLHRAGVGEVPGVGLIQARAVDPVGRPQAVSLDRLAEDVGKGFVQGPGLVFVDEVGRVHGHPVGQLVGHHVQGGRVRAGVA